MLALRRDVPIYVNCSKAVQLVSALSGHKHMSDEKIAIRGYAIPVYINIPNTERPIHHTYVIAADGSKWGCFGRDEGGTEICSGFAYASEATCLDRPDGTCGIIYGLNGVCHQTSNRILFSSGKTRVDQAGGYRVSSFLWGHYGRLRHPRRTGCVRRVSNDDILEEHDMSAFEFARGSLDATEDDERIVELIETINEEFDGALDRDKVVLLIRIQRALWDRQDTLRSQLEAKEIDEEHYLSELNYALKRSMKESEALLGEKDFGRLFGAAGHAPEDLIDRETFLKERAKNR